MSKPQRPSQKPSPHSSAPDTARSNDRSAAGLGVRRAVLGDAHVDRALAGLTEFNREFDDLITRFAWGEIWTRPGLPRPTRSMLTLGMLVALNRLEEFRLHVRGALNTGVTRDEIKEVLLQAAIYCGVPAAHSALRAAEGVFEALDGEGHGTSGSGARDRRA